MKWTRLLPTGKYRFAILGVGEMVLLAGLWWGVNAQMQGMNQAVNDLSELKDPSPFRGALMGHLGKIHLGLQGYLRSADPTLLDQLKQAKSDFESSLPEFQKQNARLFPKIAVEEITRNFTLFKQATDHTLDADVRRMKTRTTLDQNFARIIFVISHNIRPLIHPEQPQGEERGEAILNVENQARAWQQNLLQTWQQPNQAAMELTYENDSRGDTYLERYARMELLPRERKLLKEIRPLWQANGDLGRESFALEKVVKEAEAFTESQRTQVVAALNKYLPAMPPAELEQRKAGFSRAIRFHLATAFVLGLLGIASLIILALGAYRSRPGAPVPAPAPIPPAPRPDPTLQMDLKGVIFKWSAAAETLYGYTSAEMLGQPVSKLFESESDISRLYKDMQKAPQTVFETTHKTRDRRIIRVRMEFYPTSGGIGLVCTRK